MKNLIIYIRLAMLLVALAINTGMAMSQVQTRTFEKGERTLTAKSTTADYFIWKIDNVEQDGQHASTFNYNWAVGNYVLSSVPFYNGCEGKEFFKNIEVVDDVTKGDTQIVISSISPVIACSPSNAVPNTTFVIIETEFRAYDNLNPEIYNLIDGHDYAIKYNIDNGEQSVTIVFDGDLAKGKANFKLNTQNLSIGDHELRIMMLAYGNGYGKQRDYTNALHQPKITIKVRPIPTIGDIEVIQE